MTDSTNKAPRKEVVYALARASRCFHCDKKLEIGSIVRLQNLENDREVQCQSCAGLEHFGVVRSGNTKLTNLAKKYCKHHFVIMQWSELWKTYERKGILVEQSALTKAETELKPPQ